jgi:hypothetical protein
MIIKNYNKSKGIKRKKEREREREISRNNIFDF